MITRQNFELYAIDYLEGNLSRKEKDAFEAFLISHPDICMDLEEIRDIRCVPELVIFPGKEELKNISSFIDKYEHELPVLTAPKGIVYEKKSSLYRKSDHSRILFFIGGVAASLLLFMLWQLLVPPVVNERIIYRDVLISDRLPVVEYDFFPLVKDSLPVQKVAPTEPGKKITANSTAEASYPRIEEVIKTEPVAVIATLKPDIRMDNPIHQLKVPDPEDIEMWLTIAPDEWAPSDFNTQTKHIFTHINEVGREFKERARNFFSQDLNR